jgi:MoaA/NifB/PqqE/SkfB family radical SAM enzyme
VFEKPFFVILTNRCNLTCAHCYNELDPFKIIKTKVSDPLSRPRLQFLFQELVKQKYQRGYFSGGEALLRPDAPEILGDARTAGLKVSLFTNGHLFTEEMVNRLTSARLDEVRISLNELAWIKDRRQYELVFERQTRWVPALIKAGIAVGVIYLISRLNIEYVMETLDAVRSMGAGIKVQPLYMPPHEPHADVGARHIAANEWEHLINQVQSMVAATDFAAEADLQVYNNPWKILRYVRFVRDVYVGDHRPDFCPTGPILVLDSDGYFHPCLFRFDLVAGHISDDDTVRTLASRISCHEDLRTAPCFREECLSAYR